VGPKVTFIVPCYNLAHLLPECVNSILSQTYEDFEVLIMDDCSPDSTPEVAQSFKDPRIKYIRNETNLKHLANYNRGIGLARGKYIWLISADDALRNPAVLERYVQVLDVNPRVGYVFCPVVELRNGAELGVMDRTVLGKRNLIINGKEFYGMLIRRAAEGPSRGETRVFSIEAPSVMVRKECYDTVTLFPLDMPHAGDRYIWCLFALYYDVAYVAEPMVLYRIHDKSMSKTFEAENARVIVNDDVAVRWAVKQKAASAGIRSVAKVSEQAIVEEYLSRITLDEDTVQKFGITQRYFEESLRTFSKDTKEQSRIRALIYAELGDRYYGQLDFEKALSYYRKALGQNSWMLKTWVKYLLLTSGRLGRFVRGALALARRFPSNLTSEK
jgi:glycosyltransferase involved in cell wall biosynthesis